MGRFKSPQVLWTRKETKEYEKPKREKETEREREEEEEEEKWMRERMEYVVGNGYV